MTVLHQLDLYDYCLPPEQIAQEPAPERDLSRLMVLERVTKTWLHTGFSDLTDFLKPGDLLVVNDSRVIPARLFGIKETSGHVEMLLVRELERISERARCWECILRPARSIRSGHRIQIGEECSGVVREKLERGRFIIDFECRRMFEDWLEDAGHIPLPPYIRRRANESDRDRYQTVYAKHDGSVAAPTAGLHFTDSIIDRIRENGIELASLTLHVGLGTFLPVEANDIRDHRIHSESVFIPEKTADLIHRTRKCGGRVVAVGTTTVRALESAAEKDGSLKTGLFECDLYIYPGFVFRVVDAMLTNFHLPKSSLLFLCAAFAGIPFLLDAYNEAVRQKYRFYSYGDAMFIV
ncbi:MAG: tRNA preQ1(34) S-adenosylmethionine ribosyltransferase-isomerase QueA [Deltaproteobacteria bacterium]|nr:tRNA preQ1(34) S-adenosylmethionine ribosyltransferase-isomerase QueA [Deltaproteobacteria bacterium]